MRKYFSWYYLLFLALTVSGGCCFPHSPPHRDPLPCSSPPLQTVSTTSEIKILFAYSSASCLHTAMWVYAPGRPALFWDPAGGYGRDFEPFINRSRDILVTAPSLDEYLAFRWTIETRSVELFEFTLPSTLSTHFEEILRQDPGSSKEDSAYNPEAPGLFCSYVISNFIKKFGKSRFSIDTHIFPHNFAQDLYSSYPDRVTIFTPSTSTQIIDTCK